MPWSEGPFSFILTTFLIDAIGIGIVFRMMSDLMSRVDSGSVAEGLLWGGEILSAYSCSNVRVWYSCWQPFRRVWKEASIDCRPRYFSGRLNYYGYGWCHLNNGDGLYIWNCQTRGVTCLLWYDWRWLWPRLRFWASSWRYLIRLACNSAVLDCGRAIDT